MGKSLFLFLVLFLSSSLIVEANFLERIPEFEPLCEEWLEAAEFKPLASDKQLLQPHISREAWMEALSRVAIRAIYGDKKSKNLLIKISKPADSDLAKTVAKLLEYWPALQDLVHIPTRLEFAKKASAFAREKQHEILGAFFSRKLDFTPETLADIAHFTDGPLYFIKRLDKIKKKTMIKPWGHLRPENKSVTLEDWPEDKAASDLMHDEFGTILNSFTLIQTKSAQTGISNPEFVALMASADGADDELYPIVRTCFVMHASLIQSTGITEIEIKVPKGIYIGDYKAQLAIQKVIGELVYNSAKYSDPSKPTRAISVELKENTLIISDNGIGIKDKEKVWEKGYREGRKDTAHGDGYGLNEVLENVKSFGGKIELESIVGKGTKFKIELPKDLLKTQG